MEFSILLDAPDQPQSRVQIAKLGEDFEHGSYGRFAITADDVASWQRNLSQLPDHRALIDADHQADRTPRNTEASGWITGLELDGDRVMAQTEWTDKGQDAIANKRYLFISPSYGPFKDEHGKVHENTLIGAGLTNRPFLNMPAITLASEERISKALEADPAARFYTRALDGDLGEDTRALVTLDVSAAERDKAHDAGNSLPDKSYPINNVSQLKAAAVLAASKHGNWKAAQTLIKRRAKDLGVALNTLAGFADATPSKTLDSPGAMDATALLEALGLEADEKLVKTLDTLELSDEDSKRLLDAASELKQKAEQAPANANGSAAEVKTLDEFVERSGKTLEQLISEQGKVLLDSSQLTQLQSDAKAGAAASMQLHEQRFEHAFDTALQNPEGAKVTPAERDQLHHFFTLDADATIKLIEERQPIVSAKPHGEPALQLDLEDPSDPEAAARAGVHPGSHEVYRKVQAELKRLEKPQSEFSRVLDQMTQEGRL